MDWKNLFNFKQQYFKQQFFSQIKCPEGIIFTVKDDSGEIIETANNSAGEYSTLQGWPDTNSKVTRISVYAELKSMFIIFCPG